MRVRYLSSTTPKIGDLFPTNPDRYQGKVVKLEGWTTVGTSPNEMDCQYFTVELAQGDGWKKKPVRTQPAEKAGSVKPVSQQPRRRRRAATRRSR